MGWRELLERHSAAVSDFPLMKVDFMRTDACFVGGHRTRRRIRVDNSAGVMHCGRYDLLHRMRIAMPFAAFVRVVVHHYEAGRCLPSSKAGRLP